MPADRTRGRHCDGPAPADRAHPTAGERQAVGVSGPSAEWLAVLVGLAALVLFVGLAAAAAPGHAPAGRTSRWPVRRASSADTR